MPIVGIVKFFCISLLLFLASCGSRPPNAIGQDTVTSQSKKDYEELKEEGIDTQIIPWVEDKDN